ncbi:MAG TPA: CpsD/CapB family tyrosine-protein kinase [Candidatus Baltobacteraceae bacterium]|jgi:Mrp family chromosome partitioning ATPase|nr:CpsD/CapB family tyrosine-protein kinase [Candidatus Baltobacteraceae bacterium]
MSRNFDVLLREVPHSATSGAATAPNREDTGLRPPADAIRVIDNEMTKLVQQLFTLHEGKHTTTAVVFCGVNRGDGCSWVCARASEALSEQVPGRVCIVDANFRSPSLHEYFRVENESGLADAMKASGPIETFVRPSWSSHLWFVCAGAVGGDPHGPLNPAQLRTRFSQLRSEFDYVLVDAPPIGQCSDAALLGQFTDGIVLVVGCNSTRRATARAAKESLDGAGVLILGTVLNRRTYPIPEALYRRL